MQWEIIEIHNGWWSWNTRQRVTVSSENFQNYPDKKNPLEDRYPLRGKTSFLRICPVNCINSTCSSVFARFTLNVPYALQWATKCLQNCPSPDGGSGLPPNPWFSGPTKVHNPNGMSIGSAVWHSARCDPPTDSQTMLNCRNRPHSVSAHWRQNRS